MKRLAVYLDVTNHQKGALQQYESVRVLRKLDYDSKMPVHVRSTCAEITGKKPRKYSRKTQNMSG
jgi:hypothetical protein